MLDPEPPENDFSDRDEADHYKRIEFDPECTFVDEEIDSDALAFRDAMRDIFAAEGRVEILVT
jgi:hypothetical protein